MHELPITKSICDMAIREGERLGVARIVTIKIKRGAYTDYVPEIIQQYFDMLTDGTLAEGARLEIEEIPAVLYCKDCDEDYTVNHLRLRCPKCNGDNTTLKSGKEFYIENMEVED